MWTLRFCADLSVDGCDVIRSFLSKNCVISALPGYSMF